MSIKWEPKEDRDNEMPQEKPWSDWEEGKGCMNCDQAYIEPGKNNKPSMGSCGSCVNMNNWIPVADHRQCETCKWWDTVQGYCASNAYCFAHAPNAWEPKPEFDSSVDVGLKFDQGKLRLDLTPPEALEMLSRVYMYGANKKYGENNWRRGFRPGQLLAAARRHDLAIAKGEWLDPESGIPHAFHAAWNYITLGILEDPTKKNGV